MDFVSPVTWINNNPSIEIPDYVGSSRWDLILALDSRLRRNDMVNNAVTPAKAGVQTVVCVLRTIPVDSKWCMACTLSAIYSWFDNLTTNGLSPMHHFPQNLWISACAGMTTCLLFLRDLGVLE